MKPLLVLHFIEQTPFYFQISLLTSLTPLSLPPVQIKRTSSLKVLNTNCEANVNKTEPENLQVSYKALPLPSSSKKRGQFFTKQIDFHAERFDFFSKISIEKFGRNNTALTFALPFKKRVAGKAKRSLKVRKQ